MILLAVAVLLAGGLLFVKYRLEGLRAAVQAQAESRVGASLNVGSVLVNGLRGLRIDDFRLLSEAADGPRVEITVPNAYVFINAVDLLYGQITIDRVQVERARIEISRPPKGEWFRGEWVRETGARAMPAGALPGWTSAVAFRVIGHDCTLLVNNVVGDTSLELAALSFDLSRLIESTDIRAKCSGALGGAPDKILQLDLRYASLEDFDLRAQCDQLSADDVNVFLPAPQQFVRTGSAQPNIRLAGYPNKTLVVSLEMPFAGLTVRGQPEMFRPATGTLTALANYNTETHLLTLTTAQASAEQLGGRIEGTISFADSLPVLDLRAEANQLPIKEGISYLLQEEVEKYGEMTLNLEEPYQLLARLEGPTDAPAISAEANVQAGALTFLPNDPRLPSADLKIGLMKLTWRSGGELPQGTLNFSDGMIAHKSTGLKAQKINGTLTLDQGLLTLDPLSAEVTGNPFSGRAQCAIADRKVEFTASGGVSDIEKLAFSQSIKDLALSGAITARCAGAVSEKRMVIDASADLTRAAVGFEWWFRKPAGIGAGIENIKLDMTPGKTLKITGQAAVDTTPLAAAFEFKRQSGKWRMQSVRVDAEPVDVSSAGKCLRVPYTASGGKGLKGYYDWKRLPDTVNGRISRVGGYFDDIAFLPDGLSVPLRCKNVQVDAVIDDSSETVRTGSITVTAEEGFIPSLGQKWILPLRDKAEEEAEKAAKAAQGIIEPPRTWTFVLAAKQLEMLPWKGTEFTGEAFDTPEESGLRHFAANIESGSIEGSYIMQKAENIGVLSAKWNEIPAVYIVRHLNLPEALTGTMTGGVDYTIDHDDPGTLKGKGSFDIRNGQLNTAVLVAHYAESLRGDTFSFPPVLLFSRFKSSVEMTGDLIKTPDAMIESPGISVLANGQFITDGDMDYELKIRVSPETAMQIPILRASFNVEGHRLTQNQIELVFHVKGPTFNPSSRVKGLPPVGVTLVSGAAELTSEAFKVIDIPRQILMDLFRIGGGIVGVGK
jgi:hypothetical protein